MQSTPRTVVGAVLPPRLATSIGTEPRRGFASAPPRHGGSAERGPGARVWRESLDRLERAHLLFNAVSGVLPADGPGRAERMRTLDNFVAELSDAEAQLGLCLGPRAAPETPPAPVEPRRRRRRRRRGRRRRR